MEDVLWDRPPQPVTPDISGLTHFEVLPEMLTLDITEDVVDSTARHLSGSTGLGGTDAVHL